MFDVGGGLGERLMRDLAKLLGRAAVGYSRAAIVDVLGDSSHEHDTTRTVERARLHRKCNRCAADVRTVNSCPRQADGVLPAREWGIEQDGLAATAAESARNPRICSPVETT